MVSKIRQTLGDVQAQIDIVIDPHFPTGTIIQIGGFQKCSKNNIITNTNANILIFTAGMCQMENVSPQNMIGKTRLKTISSPPEIEEMHLL